VTRREVVPVQLSGLAARRIALGAQGLLGGRPGGRLDRRHARRVIEQVGLIQIDSVNVLVRSQELPLLARLGPHPRDLIPRLTAAGELFEYWGHEASHLPVALHPLLRWRMDDARNGLGTWAVSPASLTSGPNWWPRSWLRCASADRSPQGRSRAAASAAPGMWGWSPGKVAVEHLLWSGRLTATRGPNFERWYDLPERVLPA
jgi:uncharacterized protein